MLTFVYWYSNGVMFHSVSSSLHCNIDTTLSSPMCVITLILYCICTVTWGNIYPDFLFGTVKPCKHISATQYSTFICTENNQAITLYTKGGGFKYHIWENVCKGKLSWFSWFFTQPRIFFYALWPCHLAIYVYRNATAKILLRIAIFHSKCESFPLQMFSCI